jgi:type I restriction enzyme R subunit
LRMRGLVRFVEKTKRNPVYTDFEDELGEATIVGLSGVTPGTNFERFKAKAAAYLKDHEDHLALQRLRRNLQLTPEDLSSLEQMLVSAGGKQIDITWASDQTGGLGIFIRSLVGLDRHAASEAFTEYLDEGRHTVDQIRFINLIVDELTSTGVMAPTRLYESPFTDRAPTGPDYLFPDADVDVIVDILDGFRMGALGPSVA